ncbi:MAG: hypothetical protein OXG65_00680 [Chloroflexi bacterium]|nr:hypothetical protein [Chloroflexota bacterium]
MTVPNQELSPDRPSRDPTFERFLGRAESLADREFVQQQIAPVSTNVQELDKRVIRLETVVGFAKWIGATLFAALAGGAFFAFFRWQWPQ